MKKTVKEELLSLLDTLVKGHEDAWNTMEDDDDFWSAWDKMKKFIEGQPEENEGLLISDIVWCTDDDEEDDEIDLPEEVYVPADLPTEDIADYLSDEYGFLVCSFRINNDDVSTFRVSTPAGPIEARVTRDDEYPGIALVYAGKRSGEPGAIMEYVPEGDEEYPGQVVLKVWSRERAEEAPFPVLPMSPDICD